MTLMNAKLIFEEPPENFNPKVEVAACFILAGDAVLFLKRLPHKDYGNNWGIPGGKCEKEETAQDAVVREVLEETGIALPAQSVKSRGKVFIRYPTVDFIYHMFEHRMEDRPSVNIDPNEHVEYRWLSLQDALTLPLIPGEDECIDYVYGVKAPAE